MAIRSFLAPGDGRDEVDHRNVPDGCLCHECLWGNGNAERFELFDDVIARARDGRRSGGARPEGHYLSQVFVRPRAVEDGRWWRRLRAKGGGQRAERQRTPEPGTLNRNPAPRTQNLEPRVTSFPGAESPAASGLRKSGAAWQSSAPDRGAFLPTARTIRLFVESRRAPGRSPSGSPSPDR